MRRPPPADRPILLTRPLTPAPERLAALLAPTLADAWLSNCGPHHQRLEALLADRFAADHLLLTASGTAALTIALRALDVAGEVITTPLTFAATANAIVLAGCRPVFVDVDPVTLNVDPAAVAAAVTPATGAVLGVHVFGVPCAVGALDAVGRRHGVPVVYDAAHAFGSTVDGVPVTAFGAASALSFHATKLFHTAEGGAAVFAGAATAERAARLRNHGIDGDAGVSLVGENAKMSELSAAYGLAVWDLVADERVARMRVAAAYAAQLADLPGLTLPPWDAPGGSAQYFPIRIGPGARRSRDAVWRELASLGITTRRYFPLLSDTVAHRRAGPPVDVPHARTAAQEILCLPFHGGLRGVEVDLVAAAVRWAVSGP